MLSLWVSPVVTPGARPPVTAAVDKHSAGTAQPFHPCLGYGSGGPQMPHESEEATSAAKQGHMATGQRGRKASLSIPIPPQGCLVHFGYQLV